MTDLTKINFVAKLEYLRVDNEFGTEFSSLNVNKSNGKLKFRFSKNN